MLVGKKKADVLTFSIGEYFTTSTLTIFVLLFFLNPWGKNSQIS